MVSVGDAMSGESVELCRLVCDVAKARREEDGLVWMRRFGSGEVDLRMGLEIEVAVGVKEVVRFDRFEGERNGCCCISSSYSSTVGELAWLNSLSRSEFWYEAAMGGV